MTKIILAVVSETAVITTMGLLASWQPHRGRHQRPRWTGRIIIRKPVEA